MKEEVLTDDIRRGNSDDKEPATSASASGAMSNGRSLPLTGSDCIMTDMCIVRQEGASHPFIYVNLRDEYGAITESRLTPPSMNPAQRVPSLGAAFDNFVDRLGHSDQYILNVCDAMVHSTCREQFVCMLATTLCVQEARLLWDMIDVPANYATRVRNLARP